MEERCQELGLESAFTKPFCSLEPAEDKPVISRFVDELEVGRSSLEILTARRYVQSKGKCEYCGKYVFNSIQEYETNAIDHILPKKLFPKFEELFENLAFSCAFCNSRKHSYNPLQENEEPKNMLIHRRKILINRIKKDLKKKIIEERKIYHKVKKLLSA